MISVLTTILELENKVLMKKTPSVIKLHYVFYTQLIREMESNKFLYKLHGIPIQLISNKTIIVE